MHSKFLYTALIALGLVIPNTSYGYFSYEKAESVKEEIKQPVKQEQPKIAEKKVETKVVEPPKQEVKQQAAGLLPVNKGKVEVTSIKEPVSKAISEIKNADKSVIKTANSFTLGIGSLQAQLEKYSSDNGYTLVWNAQNDYYMEAQTVFSGSYDKVIQDIFKALKANNIFLRATLYSNKVLEVKD